MYIHIYIHIQIHIHICFICLQVLTLVPALWSSLPSSGLGKSRSLEQTIGEPPDFRPSLRKVLGTACHINIRILVPRPNTRGILETRVCGILNLCLCVLFGEPTRAASGLGPKLKLILGKTHGERPSSDCHSQHFCRFSLPSHKKKLQGDLQTSWFRSFRFKKLDLLGGAIVRWDCGGGYRTGLPSQH